MAGSAPVPPIEPRPRLRDRVGGPNSVTWPGFWILLVVSGLTSTASAVSGSADHAWIGIVVSVVAAVAAYGLLALARITVLRGVAQRPRPWRTLACFAVACIFAVVVSAVCGSLLAAASGATAEAGPPLDPATALLATLGTLVSAILVMALAAVVVDAWREYRAVSRELASLERALSALQSTTLAELEEQDARVRAEVEELLLSEIDALDTAPASDAASRLRHAALDVLRPMSHSLGSVELTPIVYDDSGVDVGQFVRDATSTRLFMPVVSAVITAVPALFLALLAGMGARGLLLGAAILVEIALLGLLANLLFTPRALHTSTGGRLGWLLGATAVITAVVGATWAALSSEGLGIPWGVYLGVVPVILLLPAALTGVGAVRDRQHRTLASLQDDVRWQEARARELMWVRQASLARALHGPVQSAVLAASIRLEAASASGPLDPTVIDEVRTSLQDALAAIATGPAVAVDLDETFARLQEMWSGVSEIAITADAAVRALLSEDHVCARALADVLTEGCSNAVRHGKARHVTVQISAEGESCVRMQMADDGRAVEVGGDGLGSRVLDAVALSWDRHSDTCGTVLTVLLPVSPVPAAL